MALQSCITLSHAEPLWVPQHVLPCSAGCTTCPPASKQVLPSRPHSTFLSPSEPQPISDDLCGPSSCSSQSPGSICLSALKQPPHYLDALWVLLVDFLSHWMGNSSRAGPAQLHNPLSSSTVWPSSE
ncbi:hypothetical protein mRhiFer1_010198 [Rhinolophus ferrumequinum]|uniref:Uncharacterized protein n=1 Tax=Rhinolophus ferrumequinum TaxID=59479 RepID=A0A7J7XPX5_RHIFE|nr:hypothetical protein mRhiFer1_010198 [Rhinolophus ferrumequinum]